MRTRFLLFAVVLCLVSGCAPNGGGDAESVELGAWGVDLSAREETVAPGDDFNRYASGYWLDTFEIPAGAVHLAEGEACGHQAFRRGGAVALQFHLEVTAADVARWADAYRDELRRVGETRDRVVAACERCEERMRPLAERLMANFLALPRASGGTP